MLPVGNGKIEFSEFVTMMSNAMEEKKDGHEMMKAFKVFDKDDNGFISKSELKQVMVSLEGNKITEQELDEMMSEADLDGDGKINYEGGMHGRKLTFSIESTRNYSPISVT